MCCKCNETKESMTTHVVNYKGCLIIIKNVPCEECIQCDDKAYSNDVAVRLEELVNNAKKIMQEMPVIDYAAAS